MLRIRTFLQKLKDPKDEAGTKIFGVPLDLNALEIPTIIVSSLNRLKQSVEEQGLFRVSGDHSQVNVLKKQFDEGHEVDLTQYGAHTVASLFKLYLRELPTPLIGYEIYDGLIATYSIEDPLLRRQLIKKLILTIPDYPRSVLEYVSAFLNFVQQNNSTNKMTSSNLAIVFAPNLMRARLETLDGIINDAPHVQYVVKSLIEDWDFFFNEANETAFVEAVLSHPSPMTRKATVNTIRRTSTTTPSPLPKKPSSSSLNPSPSLQPPTSSTSPTPTSDLKVGNRKSLDPNGTVATEEKVDFVLQIKEMLELAENAVQRQLLPTVDEIYERLMATTDYEDAMKYAESIRSARKILNEGPVTHVTRNNSLATLRSPSDGSIFATPERLQGIKTSMETSITTLKTDLLALLAEASSIPENCRQLEEEIALGQMIYIIQLLRNVKQVLKFKEASPRVSRVRSVCLENPITLKFAEKSLVAAMKAIINVVRDRITSQPSHILLYAARSAAKVNSLLLSPLGPLEASAPEAAPLAEDSDNQEAQSSLVEVVNAILFEVEKGVTQYATLVDRPDWSRFKEDWHTRASDILVVLESLVLQMDPDYPLEQITNTPVSPSSAKPPALTPRRQTTSAASTPSPSSKSDPFADLDPPDLVAKGASLTTVFSSVSKTQSPPIPSSTTLNSAATPNRMIKSPSYAVPASKTTPTANSFITMSTTSSMSPAALRRLSTNSQTRQQPLQASGDSTKRIPNYDLLRETVRQASAKLEGLVSRARETAEKSTDVQAITRIVSSLRVVQEMLATSFGPLPTPTALPASPSITFLKTKAKQAASEITLQLGLLKEYDGGGEEGLFQIAKTLRNVINALHVDHPT